MREFHERLHGRGIWSKDHHRFLARLWLYYYTLREEFGKDDPTIVACLVYELDRTLDFLKEQLAKSRELLKEK